MLDDPESDGPWPKRITVAAVCLSVLAVVLAGLFWLSAPGAPSRAGTAHSAASDRMQLVVVETEWCGWCKRFRRDVLPAYERSNYATRLPIRSVDLAEQARSGYEFASRVRSVPTFVLVDRTGREVDRLRGYPGGPDRFFAAVDDMLARASR